MKYTPETVHPTKAPECYGFEASQYTKQRIEVGSTVYLEADPQTGDKDQYNRLLRHVWIADGVLHNEDLLRRGFARHNDYGNASLKKKVYSAAQAEAQAAQIGLWDACR